MSSTKPLLPSQSIKYFKRGKLHFFALVLLSGFAFLFPFKSFSQGNLLVTPRRVVFEGDRRTFDLNLANTGQDTATYAISMVQIRMNDDGSFENITEPDPDQHFADKNIRYFPRSVTLPPNEAQVVKVQLRNANMLEPGEYRSHFYFRSVPKLVALGEEETEVDTTALTIRITPVFGITIPAIIRIGESHTTVTLSDLALDIAKDGPPSLSLKFNRTGNFSVYGDLKVDHISPQGKVTKVGAANGIAVYTPNLTRQFKFSLYDVPEVDFSSGKLLIEFSSSSDVRLEKYAKSELVLQ
jgi:hypothetical protein